MSKPEHTSEQVYVRFPLERRIEHLLFLISFSILGITGLAQKFHTAPISEALIAALGGVEFTRIIHRSSSVVMMIVSVYHVLHLFYQVYVRRIRWTMVPGLEDIRHLFQDLAYYFGVRKHRAFYGRYNYAEKMEYLAVVWGTVVMAVTGFMMWNPITTARALPGEIIPAAKAAHGGEAVLAVLAIIIWHFYHVHIKTFNKSMFTGKINHEEMKEEHPAELLLIEKGEHQPDIPHPVIRQRERVFYPIAGVIVIISSFGLWFFVNGEKSAITTLPRGETAQIFVPQTPTPRPTPTPTATPDPNQKVAEDTWEGKYAGMFRDRCSTCHAITAVGGLRLDTYQDALKGGNNGPAIVPNDPDRSLLVLRQAQGNHPGQLTVDELSQVIAWIKAGAPEK